MLVSNKIHQFKETEPPEWVSTPADWDSYNETVMQRERCQLGTLPLKIVASSNPSLSNPNPQPRMGR